MKRDGGPGMAGGHAPVDEHEGGAQGDCEGAGGHGLVSGCMRDGHRFRTASQFSPIEKYTFGT